MPGKREGSKRILDWEALEKAPNTLGAFSFLKSAADIISIRKDDVLTGNVRQERKTKPAKTSLAPKHCTLAQDGLSLGESVLYQVLWSRGVPEADPKGPRLVSMGWRTMARYCSLNDKGCKRNAAGLIRKLAIEVIRAEDIHNRKGRTYRVLNFDELLKRRRAAGMEWVSRDKSRRFVQKDGSPLPDNRQSSEGTLQSYSDTVVVNDTVVDLRVSHSATVVDTTTVPMVATTPGTVVATTPPLGSLLGIGKEVITSSSAEVEVIVQTLTRQAGIADSNAAIRLIGACRNHCPNATIPEIVAVIQEKAFAVRSRRDVRNPVGFLLATVPPVFEGEGIKSYRRLIVAEKEAAERAEAEHKRNEEETRTYFASERERLLNQLQGTGLTDKKRGEIQRQVEEIDGWLGPQDY
jgi:hypothetical protein